MTPNLTAFTGVDSQNLPDVMVSVQFILAIGEKIAVKIFLQIIKLFHPLAISKIRNRFILEKGIFVNLALDWR
ncbi:hypothetical protein ME808_06100 [Lactobacillus delbrueckii]|nr:hypothetical protein ME808_06100 [Lactobacillus delbrueckii]